MLGDKNDVIFFDDVMPGFGFRLRRGAGGKLLRSWIVQHRIAKRSRRIRLGSAEVLSAAQARAIAKQILARVALGNLQPICPAPIRLPPIRLPNTVLRRREYLTQDEIERLIAAAKTNRWGDRDATMILLCYRHGLRASELVDLKWEQLDLGKGRLHVHRRKNGISAKHALGIDELRALQKLRQTNNSPYVFVSERAAPFSVEGFARMMQRAAGTAELESIKVHPHMLRHSCGFTLAAQGENVRAIQHWLGHATAQHTLHYLTALSIETKGPPMPRNLASLGKRTRVWKAAYDALRELGITIEEDIEQ
jgi:type 1 fimbriae regulatory protein FimB/type 1 fimbriae regulatory protein FimE